MRLEYVVTKEGKTLGPYSEEELRQKLENGVLAPDDLAATIGSDEWQILRSMIAEETPVAKDPDGEETEETDEDGMCDGLIARAFENWSVQEEAGDWIGPYELIEEIGQGGFGLVFRAIQSEPIRRTVALKIIKPGMDTREVILRFEAERQALAMMEHPNIARVISAGATRTGRPYFVMELVEGEPLTVFCDRHRLNLRARLKLFLDVCGAVQHAHQKGIVHRDLKPSNILVREQDEKPVVKVIDFGIAKAINQELTERTLHTGIGSFIGTPQYMSPEQAGSSVSDIDTRSDIYSLGVVLYELLTSQTPITPERVREASLEEIHRLIAEVDPEKPSARVNSLEEKSKEEAARARAETPGQFGKAIRGDLDWVIMKSLAKERERRYDFISDFIGEIHRYLDNLPVLAGPPSVTYWMSKYIRRNRLVVSAAGAVAMALIAGTIVSTWQASEARHRAAEAQAVLDFLETNVIAAARPKGQEGGLGIDATIRDAINAAELKLEGDFSDWPEVEASLRVTLGTSHRHLGEYDRAISQCEEGLRLRQETLGAKDPDTFAAMESLALAYAAAGRNEEALALRKPVYAQSVKKRGERHPETLSAANALANSLAAAGRSKEALEMRQRTLALRQEILGEEDPDTLDSMNNLLLSFIETSAYAKAVELGEKTLELSRKVRNTEHPSTLATMNNLAVAYRKTARGAEADKLEMEALTLRRRIQGETHPDTIAVAGGTLDPGGDLESGQFSLASEGTQTEVTFALPRTDSGIEIGADIPVSGVLETLLANPELSEFVSLLRHAGRLERLSGAGPFTLMAPVNQSFGSLPEGELEKWLDPSGSSDLRAVLNRHVITDRIPGVVLDLDGRIDLTGVEVIQSDVLCTNGLIHLIDSVMGAKTN